MGMTYHQAILALTEGKPITHPDWAPTGPGDPFMFAEKRPNGLFLRFEGEPEAEMEDTPFEIGDMCDVERSPDWLIYEPAPEPEAEWPKYELGTIGGSSVLRIYLSGGVAIRIPSNGRGRDDRMITIHQFEEASVSVVGGFGYRCITRQEAIDWIKKNCP